jgi:hypothetical protein
MSSPHSAPAHTWRVLLPWLDWLAPSEIFALQRLGGPVQWWLRETPSETCARHAAMEDVFELLGSFLESAPLDGEPLSSLLPALPVAKPTASLEITSHARAVLEAAGGPTLGTVGRLTPRIVLHTLTGSMQEWRDVLAVLVCEGALLGSPAPESTQQLSRSAPEPAAMEDPDDAVVEWFRRLDSRQQDLIVRHLCAGAPYSVEVLAAGHRTLRERMGQLLADLPSNLRQEAGGNPGLGHAVALFETAVREPVTRTELGEHQPWLRSRLVAWDVTVLDVMAAVLLGASAADEWLFAGSLTRARTLTLDALALEPGESMSPAAASRLLAATGIPLKPTQAWLQSCGLDLVRGQVERSARKAPVGRGTAQERNDDGGQDFLLAPPAPLVGSLALPMPEDGAGAAAHPGKRAASAGPSSPESTSQASARLQHVLDELHSYVVAELPGGRLIDLLDGSAPLPEPLKTMVARLLAATGGADGWVMPEDPPALILPSNALRAEHAAAPGPVDTPADESSGLADEIMTVLAAAQAPLTSSEILGAVPEAGDLKRVVQILFRDPRMAITDSGGWTLSGGEGSQTGRAESADRVTETMQETGGSVHGTLKEGAWQVLDAAGHPLPLALLAKRMGQAVDLRSLKTQLLTDPRFMRSDADAWALTVWGLREYTTIKDLVSQEVRRADGEIPTAELLAILTRDFSIKESSLLQVASSPPFTARGGVVRRLGDVRDSGSLPARTQRAAGSDGGGRDDEGPSTDDLIDLMGL